MKHEGYQLFTIIMNEFALEWGMRLQELSEWPGLGDELNKS